MAASPPKPPSTVEGEALLQSLGYNQQLKRKINVLGNLALVLSDITPTASLLIVGTVVIVTAGTGSIAAYLIGCFLAINVALCMGELGSMFPVAGGLFSIVTRVLGKPIGFLAMLDYMGQAVFLPASVAVGWPLASAGALYSGPLEPSGDLPTPTTSTVLAPVKRAWPA